MKRIGYRSQRTLATTAEVSGRGFITGARSRVRFEPAPADTGIVFVRHDLPGRPSIPARVENVTGTRRRTTLGELPEQVTLVEHVLAALAGLRIDNCYVELDAPEPPGLDGSARGFVDALTTAGVVRQPARREIWTVRRPQIVGRDGATLAIHPIREWDHPTLKITYTLDYGLGSPIPPQSRTCMADPGTFRKDIASCRTFLLDSEAKALQAEGIGCHLGPSELLVFSRTGRGKPYENSLRYADEPCRHKVLDIIGDLALCGVDLVGHVVAYRSGHPLNVELARRLAVAVVESVECSRNAAA